MNIKSLFSAFVVGATLTASSALANTAWTYDTAYDGDLDGGEFYTVLDTGFSFYSFCLEAFTHVDFGTGYSYSIDSRAFGGSGDSHDIPGNPAGDALSNGTAWLYEQFATNQLTGPTGTGSYWDNHDTNAGLLQLAIWGLEDEFDVGPNPYIALAIAHFGGNEAFTRANDVVGHVQVLNLWQDSPNGDRRDIQSQLILVPDTGMTAALLGLGLVSLAAFRRRKVA